MSVALVASNARPTPEQREQIIEHVLEQLSNGRAVSRILAEDDGMPVQTTWSRWERNDEDLQQKIARARLSGADYHVHETVAIADESSNDVYIDYVDDKPVARIDGDAIQRAKLRIETRFKAAAMIAPRKYGAKVDVTSGGEKIESAQPVLVDARMQSLIQIAMNRKQTGVTAIEDLGFD